MTRQISLFFTTIIIFLNWSCNNSQVQADLTTSQQNIDTTNAIKIQNLWVTPKKTFEFNSLGRSTSDTISFVTCSEYVYSPFGQISKKSDLENGLLKKFSISNRVDSIDNAAFEFQILHYGQSRLIIFFDNDPEATKHSYIFKGNISDGDVDFINGIKIGIDKELFLQIFFENFPKKLMLEFNVFVFESCVQDIKHIYTFKADKLQSINFGNYSHWTVNY